MRKPFLTIAVISLLALVGLLAYLKFPSAGEISERDTPGVQPVPSKPAAINEPNRGDGRIQNSNHPSAVPQSGSNASNVNFAVAYAAALNQQQALDAINKGYAEKDPVAIEARLNLAVACRLTILKPQLYDKTAKNPYQAQLFKYCQGYSDALDQQVFDTLLLLNLQQGLRTRMKGIEKAQGLAAALLDAENTLKEEQDPLVARHVLQYLGDTERVHQAGIAQDLPEGVGLVYQPRDAMYLASELLYCELSGGCGPYHLETIQLCAGVVTCPPGATVRDFYSLVSPPALMHAADTILSRWRALRQCGRYQCG